MSEFWLHGVVRCWLAGKVLCRINSTLPYQKDNCKWLELAECRRAQGVCVGRLTEDGLPAGMTTEGGLVRAGTVTLPDAIVPEQSDDSPVLVDAVAVPEGETQEQFRQRMATAMEQADNAPAVMVAEDDDLEDVLDDFDPWADKENDNETV